MSFQKVKKAATRRGIKAGISVTIHKTGTVSLTKDAYESLGEPSAAILEFDPDTVQLRITASSPEDPDAFRLDGKAGPKFPGRSLLRHAGLDTQGATIRCPGERAGRFSITADLGGLHRAGVTPIRRAS